MKKAPYQLSLFDSFEIEKKPEQDIAALERKAVLIARRKGLRVSTVKWKNNRQVMASVGKGGVLNLHTIYQNANDSDFEVLASVLNGRADNPERERFYKFIERHLAVELQNGSGRIKILHPTGVYQDLLKAKQVIWPLLDDPIVPEPIIGWSPVRVGRKQITWGTHRKTPEGPLVLVNQVLDDPDTPNYVIEHILWHELCHQLQPPQKGNNGRRDIHSNEFRKLEQKYPRWKEAELWEEKNVGRLIKRYAYLNRGRKKR